MDPPSPGLPSPQSQSRLYMALMATTRPSPPIGRGFLQARQPTTPSMSAKRHSHSGSSKYLAISYWWTSWGAPETTASSFPFHGMAPPPPPPPPSPDLYDLARRLLWRLRSGVAAAAAPSAARAAGGSRSSAATAANFMVARPLAALGVL